MFFVNDTQARRHDKVRAFLQTESVIAVLLGAADFEWTVRRAIIALGESPNVELREQTLDRCHGLDSYKKAWKKEVQPMHETPLAEVIPNWQFFTEKAFPLRHRIIHGAIGSVSSEYAGKRVEAMLDASRAIVEFATIRGFELYQRLKVRRRKTTA